ncbi:TonB-dependent siderophore receptor [Altericroceibacterium endophyticum]|uniref:TonB-dependent siderophore receptor n=1 Tax=Altericroceibacterium endophyticum TaxID=1808508 RepID=A0A6I4T9N3_9SPHN|nr:TonB-dependent siderophore receptor [Altericroceibacterium endophyticum]MXO66723.1 TonB-dependent siderophore receptor [Altericroceibacterium endophyticum]
MTKIPKPRSPSCDAWSADPERHSVLKQALIASLFATSILATPANAQTAPPPEDDIEQRTTIIVTGESFVGGEIVSANKDGGDILTTPQAISVVEDDFIDALNLRAVAEALNYTSGVRSQSFGSDTRIEYYQIRGFRNENLYKDGLVLTNSGAFLSWTTPAEGIGRLEVLKGPSSVLYGGGSAGGIVNIVSKQPDGRKLAAFEIGADEYGSVYGSADMGAPLSDTLAIRANGLVRRGDTQVELAEDNRTFGALALGWTPLPGTTLTLRGSYTRDRSQRPTGFLPYEGFVTPLPDGRRIPTDLFLSDPSVDRYDRDQYEAGYTLETNLSDAVRFVSNGRYAEIDLIYAGLYGQFRGNPVIEGGNVFITRGNSRQDAHLDNVTIDNHLDGRFATGAVEHTLLGGVDYAWSQTESAQASGSAPRLDVFAPVYDIALPALGTPNATAQKLDRTGVYLQDRLTLGGLTGLLSVRHDWIGSTSTSNGGAATRQDSEKTTYRAGISYLTAAGLAPFVSYSTSFTPVFGIDQASGEAYSPETGEAWEAGIKYQADSFPLLATASLFSIERDGVLVANPVPDFPRNQSQAGLVRSRGGEIEVQAHPLETLNITAALTAFDIENREGDPALIGLDPPATPEFAAAAFVDYTLPESSFLPGFGFGLGVRHTGSSYADAANTLVVPAATVFDAALHYDFANFRLGANFSNLFDKHYVSACPSAGTCYAANLRRATISLAYRFGDDR